MSQLGIDHAIVQEMMADGYDPTQQREWAGFRQLTMGDSAMLATKDRVEDWRNRGESFGQRFGKRPSIIT